MLNAFVVFVVFLLLFVFVGVFVSVLYCVTQDGVCTVNAFVFVFVFVFVLVRALLLKPVFVCVYEPNGEEKGCVAMTDWLVLAHRREEETEEDIGRERGG